MRTDDVGERRMVDVFQKKIFHSVLLNANERINEASNLYDEFRTKLSKKTKSKPKGTWRRRLSFQQTNKKNILPGKL